MCIRDSRDTHPGHPGKGSPQRRQPRLVHPWQRVARLAQDLHRAPPEDRLGPARPLAEVPRPVELDHHERRVVDVGGLLAQQQLLPVLGSTQILRLLLQLGQMCIRDRTSFGATLKPDGPAMGWYLALWGLFTLMMFIGTLRLICILKVIFLSLTILFFLLAIGKFWPNESLEHFTGYEGIFCGLSAFYAGMAAVINEVHGKDILPTGAKKS